MKFRRSVSIIKLAAFALALGAASAQTQVTLGGAPYNVMDGPIGLLDGPCAMGAWSSSTNYHDLEAVSYDGAWYRAISQSGPGTSSGAIPPGTNTGYWVASTNNLSGSGSVYTCNMWGTSGSGRAQASNPGYAAAKLSADAFVATGYSTQAGADIDNEAAGLSNGFLYMPSFNCAVMWVAEGAPDQANDTGGYLPCALNAILHAEDFNLGATLCDQSSSTCGAYGPNTDYATYEVPQLAMIYTIVRDKLTSQQVTTFMNKMWNDNASTSNGLGLYSNPAGACTPLTAKTLTAGTETATFTSWTTTQTSASLAVVGTGTHFTTNLAVGDIIYQFGHVASITDDTHLTLTAPAGYTGTYSLAGQVVPAWNDSNNNCGLVWFLKHGGAAPPVGTPSGLPAYESSYPVGSGNDAGAVENLSIHQLSGYIPLAFVSAADDARAQTAATEYFNFFNSQTWPALEQDTTGFMRPQAYTYGLHWMLDEIVLSIEHSVPSYNSTPFLGMWAKNQMPFYYELGMYDQSMTGTSTGAFGVPWMGAQNGNAHLQLRSAMLSAALFPGSAEAGLTNYWQKTSRGDYVVPSSCGGLNPYGQSSCAAEGAWLMIFTDPSNSGTALSTIPTQYIWDRTDLNPGGGPTASATTCLSASAYYQTSVNGNDCRLTYWASRTGFGETDTVVLGQSPFYDGYDHSLQGGVYGAALSIYRQGFLLAGDVGTGDGYGGTTTNTDPGQAHVFIGGVENWRSANDINGWNSAEIRWAGSHPGGVSSGSYAYAEFDPKAQYATTVTNALREVAHLKGGSQDYVVVHDWVSVPSGTTINSVWPLYVGPTSYFSSRMGTVTATSWASLMQAQVVVTNASLIMQALQPAGSNTLAAVDIGMGAFGMARMEQLCASTNGTSCSTSATSMESLVVLKAANTTSPSMPPLTQPTAGANWAVVQIADSSSPKVAAFARGPATQTSLGFTSTHSGTAQYMIAGLTAGTYNVTLGGTAVSGSPFTVVSGDNTLSFQGTAGLYSIASTGTPGGGHNTCDLNNDGVVNILDVQLATSQALGITQCTTGNLTGNGCNVVDVQIVVNAVLTGVCTAN